MILASHPDRRFPGLQAIGYWRSPERPGLPNPRNYVDRAWSPAEREAVARYLEAGRTAESWRGYAPCRMCSSRTNGSRCLTDGTYVWPEGFAHYIREHEVKPPRSFIDHVLASAA